MRKYFLLSAVALLAATNVNAGITDAGKIDVSATITRVNTYSCTPLNFGNIAIANDTSGWVELQAHAPEDPLETSSSVISVEEYSLAYCLTNDENVYEDLTTWSVPSTVELSDGTDTLYATITVDTKYIGGRLEIDEYLDSADTFTGSFYITKVSE
ncbi:MAG: hypothetical protein IJF12_00630 [Alphaproteobacteria bacterium]|nr:hypothetical protein [Alphaproteobacteria bacterium]